MSKRKIEIFTAVLCGLVAGSVITKVPDFLLVSEADSNYSFDVNGDGNINVMDLNCLKTYLFNIHEDSENSDDPSVTTSPDTESSPQPDKQESGNIYKLEKTVKLNIPESIRECSEDEPVEESEKNIAEVQKRIYSALVDMGMDKDVSVVYKKYYGHDRKDYANKNSQGLDVITATLEVPSGEYGIDAIPLKKFIKSTGQDSYGDSNCIETYGKINVELVTDKDDNIIFIHFYDAGNYYDDNTMYDYSCGIFSNYIYENSSDITSQYTNAIANDLLSRSVLHYIVYKTGYLQKYMETDTEYIVAMLPGFPVTEEYTSYDVLLDNNSMSSENVFFISVDKTNYRVSYKSEKRQYYYGTSDTAVNIVREFLNEDIDQSAYCEIKSDKESYTSIDYPVYETLSTSFGTNRLSRVHIGFSSADEKTIKAVYARLAEKCGQIPDNHYSIRGIDVYLMNGRIVNCCNCNYNYHSQRNYYTFSYVRSKNTDIVNALDKYFGNDVKSRICFYESICRYATYSNNKVSYNSGYTESDGKLKYTQLSDELISVSIEIPELSGLNRVYYDNNETLYPCKYANGDEIKPGNIKFIINTRTKTVEKIAATN